MAIDGKYGKITFEIPNSIGEGEPVVVFRAQDHFLSNVLSYYARLCEGGGSPQRHIDLIMKTRRNVLAWQVGNPTKIPESAGYEHRDPAGG